MALVAEPPSQRELVLRLCGVKNVKTHMYGGGLQIASGMRDTLPWTKTLCSYAVWRPCHLEEHGTQREAKTYMADIDPH